MGGVPLGVSSSHRQLTTDTALMLLQGRNIESFGEDPALISALGSSYVKGMVRASLVFALIPAPRITHDNGAAFKGVQIGRDNDVDKQLAASGYLKIMAVPKHLGAYSVILLHIDILYTHSLCGLSVIVAWCRWSASTHPAARTTTQTAPCTGQTSTA